MSSVLTTVLPVFTLIAIGYIAGRTRFVSEAAARGLPEFMFKIAMPALLFRTLATAKLPDGPIYAIFAAYFCAAIATCALATALSLIALRRPAADAPSIGFAASFSNVVMMGIPLCLSHFGPEAAGTLALIAAFDVPVMWTLAALQLAAVGGAPGQSVAKALSEVAWRLATNTIILSCALGLTWQFLGLGIHPLADRIISLLGQAGIPGALCALGLTLSTFELKGQAPTVILIALLKMLAMPAAAWLLAYRVFELPPVTASVIVVLAALPVGANAFLFASANKRAEASVSGSIALTMPVSLVTVSALLWLVGH
jgi:predicted permease